MKKISKQIFALLLAIVMVLPVGLVPDNLFVTKAEAANKVSGAEIVAYAKNFIGYPYGHGYGPKIFDCSGLVQYVFGHFGIKLPWSTKGGYRTYGEEVDESKAKPGDLVVWSGHVGIYSGDGYCINALNYDAGVCTTKITSFVDGNGKPNPKHWYIRVKGVGETNIVSKPTASTTNYVGGVKVTLKSATSGATIYYTTNGNTPTTSSTKYSGAFNLTSTATVKAIAVKSGMDNSSVVSKKVTVNKVTTPTIKNTVTSSGFNITITAEKGATVYYTTDGSNPTTKSTKYEGPFSVYENATVKAIATASGKANSAAATAALSATVPAAPSVKLDSSSKSVCGIGDSATVSWKAVSGAYEYEAVLSKDGQAISSYYTQSCLATFTPAESGTYKITVKAVNFVGESAASSPAVTVTVKPNVKVTFKDYDGKVIEEKSVKYGASAEAPVPTKRTGYEFKAWSGTYINVTADSTVTATYTANTYTIIFVDEKGNELAEEVVSYGSAVKNVPSAPSKTGYKFAAWSVKSGEGDSYTNVNGNVVFEPTYVWANPDLPLAVKAEKAVRSSDLKSYDVTVKITNSTNKVVNGKIIAVIKTANDKIVATAISAVAVPASASNYSQTVKIGSSADGMLSEVYIVANDPDNSNRTGGAYSEKASVKVTREVSTTEKYWSDWSSWGTTAVSASSTREVETKVQYRYRDKQTTTSTKSSLSGWTPDGKADPTYGSWSSWSSWSTTKQTETDVKDVETKTLYRYYYYACASCKNRQPYWNVACDKCGKHVDDSVKDYYWSTTPYSKSKSVAYGSYKRKTTSVKGSEIWYFSAGNLNHTAVGTKDASGTATIIKTGYRYRTRTKTENYKFWKWGDYSPWSDTVYTANSTRQVETRTLYRYKDLKERASTGTSDYIVTENLSGTTYNISGKLSNVSTDYSGKIATVMVYKDRNTDPTESQIEYVGQIKLGSGNSYNFKFVPKEEISEETGNYIVSFGIATASGLVNNVEIIEAPKPVYKVDFYGADGVLLGSQDIEKGGSAVAPSISEIEGYDMRWDRTFTNITAATSVKAEAIPKTYNVIFVDWANDEIIEIAQAKYGEKIVFPDAPEATGKKFVGWSEDEGAVVNGTMIVEAIYENLSFTATFLNKDGSVFENQTVYYGDAVVIPEENPTAEGFEFITWSNESKWWDVKEDITIEPIFVYDTTVETPVFDITEDVSIGFARVEIETSTEGAEIRYTTDGTEPTEESILFEDVIYVEETTTIKAKAFKGGMLETQSVENTFEVISSDVITNTKITAVTDVSNYEIGNDYAKICMRIDNPYGYEISSWGYVIMDASNDTFVYENTDIAGTKDKVIGRVFTVDSLKENESYLYYFFVNFAEIGSFESDCLEFTTKKGADVFSFSLRNPSKTTISYGDGIILHADASGTVPSGSRVEWSADNGCFEMNISTDGSTCTITPKSSGSTTFTVKLLSADGEILSEDTQVMTSKAGFFDKLIAFFKGIFGLTKTYPE